MKRSKDGILYSLDVLSEKIFLDDEEKDTEFEGIIESNLDILENLNNITSLRIGAYTTSGFGKCTLNTEIENEEESIKSLKRRIEDFNSYIKDNEKYYISFTLVNDAYLGLEEAFKDNIPPSEIEKEEFINKYEEILREYIGKELKLEILMVNNEWRRGFDTSKKTSKS